MMIKPRKLKRGDRVAAVSLSWGGPGTFRYRYDIGKKQFEDEFGVTVVEMPHACADPAWIAKNPRARADDLMAAFADPSIEGIITTIGDDSIRLLPFIDLSIIRANPKVFLGYSDTTVTHFACYRAGLVSFYGPSFMAGFAENGGMFPYMVESVRRTLFSAESIGAIAPNTAGWTVEHLDWSKPENQQRRRVLTPSDGDGDGDGDGSGARVSGSWRFLQGQGRGRVSGRLLGGCIEILDWLRGTPVWPEREAFDGAMLFIETSEEAPPPSAVARMLRNFGAMGILDRLSAILMGRPGGQVPPDKFQAYDDAVLQVVSEELGLTELPIVTRMDFGHTDPMFVLPYGVTASLDCDARTFSIDENAVTD